MKEDIKIAAANITALRKDSKLTQTEFGELHKSNQKAIWTYEKGKAGPGKNFLMSLSRAYSFDPELLFSLKFKVAGGKITNIPKVKSEINLLKVELIKTIDELDSAYKSFTKRIDGIKQQLQKLENKQSK
jgi:transcriptional regulator with XRE-family HTH domain